MSKKPIALRCSICAINWPMSVDYKICPICQDEDGTSKCRSVKPMDLEEAESMKAHADFERFYEDWDAKKPAERLKPEREIVS